MDIEATDYFCWVLSYLFIVEMEAIYQSKLFNYFIIRIQQNDL